MPQVKVTMFTDPIDVDDEEVEILRRQGLLVEDDPAPQAEAAPAFTPPATDE